jgi:hypothetical protein
MSLKSEAPAAGHVLRNTHRSVLILLAAAGGAIALGDLDAPAPDPEPHTTGAGLALALAAILLRRFASSATIHPGKALWLALASLIAAGCLGLLGGYVALQTGSSETGLLFTLAGFIFALRVPRPVAPHRPR